MRSAYININNHKFHYLHAGSGSRLLIAFHGYRNDASLFRGFIPYLEQSFTILFIDLPYHGKTIWENEQLFTKEDLKKLVIALKTKFGAEKISLLGYSIGGRICLCVAELVPEYMDKCVLVASDGLVYNPFYYFVTKNKMGKWLFKSVLSNEKNLLLLDKLKYMKVMPGNKHRFIMHSLKTHKDREQLRQIWNNLSVLLPDYKKLRQLSTWYSIPVSVFMGEKDTVIPVAKAKKFANKIPAAQLVVLKKGHRVMDEETIPLIAEKLIGK